ncbi:Aste57867_19842 [Aphanomyces stellatus]|uniref:Aste57867_19842 protein n=1 Tax=Aphanomyces stellatus TaxID=120398 RepID=A0A485LDP8_9STRA|nr:hypothetical protein As57867_019777 [Aphanomyces stellatus]VFT96540.1 Aste57867_19842 [Aphanomyces stellatus]
MDCQVDPNVSYQPLGGQTPTTRHTLAKEDSVAQLAPTVEPTAALEPEHTVKHQHPITYRPDIDGLRALAVIPVVIFHSYPKALPGGFIGVDIFFVISGYLISSILFKEHTKGTFTYADFYSRRIRRIFPALILVLGFTLTLSCLWLMAKPLKTMAATMIAGTCFGANLQLLTYEQGYFDASIKEIPLLHLWSLGVEEQFYIFWPFFAALVVKLSPRNAILAQCLVLVASFVCNIAFLGFHGSDKYSFYFPLSRFWQMSIGGLLAYINMPSVDVKGKTASLSPFVSAILSTSGLTAVVVGFFIIEEAMAFPGYWSLLPTLGAAALITAGPTTPFNHHILGSFPMVFVGQISYALYLWHWPLLVLSKVHFPNDVLRPWYMEPYSMAILAVVLSVATLYVIENNLRRRKGLSVVPTLCGLALTLLIVSIFVYNFPDTFSSPARAIAADSSPANGDVNGTNWSRGPRQASATTAAIYKGNQDWHPWGQGTSQFVFTDTTGAVADDDGIKVLNQANTKQLVIVLGDSHANMVAPRFSRLFELAKNQSNPFPQVMFRTRDGTPSLSCIQGYHAANVEFIKTTKPQAVLYVSNWIQFLRAGGSSTSPASPNPVCCKGGYVDTCEYQSQADVVLLVDRLRDELQSFGRLGIQVFVATTNPEGVEYSIQSLLNGANVGSTDPISRAGFRQKFANVISLVEGAIKAANATTIDLSDNQCFEDECQVISMKEGEPVFKDTNHIRPYYARNYLSVLDQVVNAALV